MANTNGRTIYLGVSAKPKDSKHGVPNAKAGNETMHEEIDHKLTPPIEVGIDILETQGKQVIRLQVPRGSDPPYALDDNKIYVRDEAETNLAVRDEIVQLVMQNLELRNALAPSAAAGSASADAPAPSPLAQAPAQPAGIDAPRTGVEIIATEERKGVKYHVMRDLRNGNVVKNVTRSSARR